MLAEGWNLDPHTGSTAHYVFVLTESHGKRTVCAFVRDVTGLIVTVTRSPRWGQSFLNGIGSEGDVSRLCSWNGYNGAIQRQSQRIFALHIVCQGQRVT